MKSHAKIGKAPPTHPLRRQLAQMKAVITISSNRITIPILPTTTTTSHSCIVSGEPSVVSMVGEPEGNKVTYKIL